MKRPVGTRLLGLLAGLLVVLCAASEIPEPQPLEQLRTDAKMYHTQFMDHLEASMARLNESLYDWREQGHPHAHLGALASHSMDVLTNLDNLASSEVPGASGPQRRQRRNLSQIYDEASRQVAEERLAGVTAEAEARYAEAVDLLQSAAASAIQNNTEDLMARLADKLRAGGVVSTGKIVSEQLQTLQLADTVAESIRGLVPEFDGAASKGLGDVLSGGLSGLTEGISDGLSNIFGGSLFGRFREEEPPAPGMAAPAPEDQAGLTVDLAYDDDKLVVSTGVADAAEIYERVEAPDGVTVTPLNREAGEGTNAPYDPLLDDTVSRSDFYKERNEVFDRFDDEVELSAQAKTQRRSLQSARESPINVDAIIQRVDSSLEAMRAMRERGIAVSKETTEAIKARLAAARTRFKDMTSEYVGQGIVSGRRLSQTVSGDDDDDFLVFPGESVPTARDLIGSGRDKIIDGDSQDESSTVSAMDSPRSPEDSDNSIAFIPIMPMAMSQEINFVFIPVDGATDAEELMEFVANTVMSVIAEATMSMITGDFMYPGMDLAVFDAYDPSYELPDGTAPLGFGPVQLETATTYHEPHSATQKRRRLKSSAQSMTNLLEDSYDLEVFFYDPVWFDSASKMMLYDDEIPELSLAIRLGGPEDMGGLPPDVLMFLAESEAMMDAIMANAMMPSYSVFQASANQANAQANNDNLADAIVKKLQSAYGAYGEPSKAQDPHYYSASELDIKWLGVMFGAVGIVLIIAIGAITAFQSRAQTSHPGYVVIDDIRAVQPHQATKLSSRKTSNLPA